MPSDEAKPERLFVYVIRDRVVRRRGQTLKLCEEEDSYFVILFLGKKCSEKGRESAQH